MKKISEWQGNAMGRYTSGFQGIVNVADFSLVMEPQVFITLYFIIYICYTHLFSVLNIIY